LTTDDNLLEHIQVESVKKGLELEVKAVD